MTARVRLKSLALIVALAGAGAAAVVAAPIAHADPVSSFTEYPIPAMNGSLGGLTTGPDGNLWWVGNGSVNTMSPAGGAVTQYSAPNSTFSYAITVGPDGNLWFTAGTDIGRITTAGAISYFTPPVGHAGYRFQSIAAGPDGKLWYIYSRGTGGTHPIFGSIDTAGVMATYSPAINASLASQIVAGPGGRMWWIDRNIGSINSFDPANPIGTLTTFTSASFPDVPNAFSGTLSIAAGSDGNIWYSRQSSIGRLTPAGTLTIFPTQAQDTGFPNSVALGPDGNIWFNRNYNGRIFAGRMKPDGTSTVFDLTGTASANTHQATSAGPDGNLWFIERDNAHIGRISPNSPADPTRAVLNLASGFSNNSVRLAGPGSSMKFVFEGPVSATATDTTGPGLSLFDSGSQSFFTTYSHTYDAAGTYTYADTAQPSHTGTVAVPPTATPNYIYAGGTFLVQWASGPPPAGFEYDVQRQDPGATFADYLPATTSASTYGSPGGSAGTYLYRARLHRISDDVTSGWSPPVGVRYGAGTPAAFGGYPTQRSVFRPDSGGWFVDDSGPSTSFFGLPGYAPVPADYTGDGATDRAVYRPDVGGWYLDDGGPSTFFFGLPGDLPVPADYDGNGTADRAVFRPDAGAWYIDDGGPTIKYFGLSGDVPVPGDYDGDGKADEAVYRPSTGQWYVLRSSDSVVTVTNFGLSGDVPVPGDYDGDNQGDLAVFRPSTGTWYVRYSTGAPDRATIFGTSGDIPAPGDYNADGRTDLAVFRPSTGLWYVRPTGGGGDTATSFGLPGDIPLPLPAAIERTYFP